MPFDTFSASIPPVDAELVDRIVSKLKSQGIFDQFRKDCLADVDTKPAYQNLQQRVNGTVASFLATQQWQPDLNKTQLRETLRKHVQQGFLEVGVDRIVDQVVNPKIVPLFMPKVEDVVCDCLGIEKPNLPRTATFTQFLTSFPPPLPRPSTPPTLSDLLPKDLDPVSPESDNLCLNGGDTPLKDERNNNDSSLKYDDDDSQLSGISDLSSHIGDSSYRDIPLNPADSNTVKSISSPKPENETLQFDNFTNLSEKIKQAEKTHGQVSGPNPEETVDDMPVSEELTGSSPKDVKEETTSEEVKYEFLSNNSISTFEDSKTFVTNKLKDETLSQTCSEDSMSSNVIIKEKNENILSKQLHDSESSNMVIDTQDNNDSLQKETFKPVIASEGVNEQQEEKIINKTPEKASDVKEDKKDDDKIKEKKTRDSSTSSKYSRSSEKHKYDRHSDSKHRSSHSDKKDDKPLDHSNEKDKSSKEDKGEKSNKDEKYKVPQKDDKHKSHRESSHRSEKESSNTGEKKEKYKKEERDKGTFKDKEKISSKDDQSGHKSQKDDRNKLKEERHSSSKDRHREKERSDRTKGNDSGSKKDGKTDLKDHLDKERKGDSSTKEKDQNSKSKYDNDKDKEPGSRTKHDHDKDKRDRNDKDKLDKERKATDKDHHRDKSRHDKEKDRDGKYDKDKTEKSGKHDKEKVNDEKSKDNKKKDSKSHEKTYHSSSSSRKSENKSDDPDRKQKTDETNKNKPEEEKKDRKRKSESCKNDIKAKDPRRSSDRDNSGSKGLGGNRTNTDNKTSSSHNSKNTGSDKKSRGSSSNGTNTNQDQNEKESDQVDGVPSDQLNNGLSEVDIILSKLNSSIEEIENSESNKAPVIEEVPIKKPKIAKNFAEIRKIMQARKNIDRKIKGDFKSCRDLNEINMNSSEEPENCNSIETRINEENKENFKTSEFEKTKVLKNSSTKNKCFVGFHETEIEKSINNYLKFENNAYILNYERTIHTQSIIDNYKQSNMDLNEDLVDNNLNKLNPKILTVPEETAQENKLVENMKGGSNMYNIIHPKCLENNKHTERPPPLVREVEIRLERLKESDLVKAAGGREEASVDGTMVVDRDPNNRKRPAPPSEGVKFTKEDAIIERCTPEIPAEENPSNPSSQETVTKEVFPLSPEVVSDEDKGLSISLTEDMLDNLMKESMCIDLVDTAMDYSDDSDCEGRTETKEIVVNQNITPLNHKKSLDDSFDNTEDVEMRGNIDNQPAPKTKADNKHEECRIINKTNSISPKSGNDVKEKDGSNKHPRRLSRSTQRYNSTDLYKPRPVIPQNSKRVRAPKSEPSEDSLSKNLRPKRDLSEPGGKRKRSR